MNWLVSLNHYSAEDLPIIRRKAKGKELKSRYDVQ
jgi:hypothetical protein